MSLFSVKDIVTYGRISEHSTIKNVGVMMNPKWAGFYLWRER